MLSDFGFESQTSADLRSLKPCQTCDNELAKIDKIKKIGDKYERCKINNYHKNGR